jgi:hypothetical protein
MTRLSRRQRRVLRALAEGWTLKSHRYLSGVKVCRLHALDGRSRIVPRRVVAALREKGLLFSNQKFPAATYLLTSRGRQAAARLIGAGGETESWHRGLIDGTKNTNRTF